jgi:hypothetical protein
LRYILEKAKRAINLDGDNLMPYDAYLNKYKDRITNYIETDMENLTIILSILIMGSFGIKIATNKNKILNHSVLSQYDYKVRIMV